MKNNIPLYGELEIIAGSDNDVLRVLVPQAERVGVVDSNDGVACAQTSCLGRRSVIHLEKSQRRPSLLQLPG